MQESDVSGITPAYAGKRPPEPPKLTQQEDHPRLCGEKFSGTLTPKTDSGSPPPMRGKKQRTGRCAGSVRITPAYAGKNFSAEYAPHSCRDHPRLCGEKICIHISRCWCLGSPPPMRGKTGYNSRHYDQYRITPAYAGKKQIWIWESWGSGDHPRLCGEKQHDYRLSKGQGGSPPPMRGKSMDTVADSVITGITPAYAGKNRRISRLR